MAQQKVIIIPAKWIVIILTTFFTLCIIAFFIENKRVENYRPVEKKDSINLLITNKQSRGGIFINDSIVPPENRTVSLVGKPLNLQYVTEKKIQFTV